ncbi:MAG TPA: hypothetical protein VKP11_06450, partial [Frankiaceae bacterium]|nr:hypothetical protein [Frankiaceae bacterium]
MHPARVALTAARRHPWRAAAALALVLAGCATMRGLLALKQVDFEVDRVATVRLAGVSLDQIRSPSDIGVLDAARIAAAVARHQVPLVFDLHLLGRNPADNNTTARLVRM